MAALASLSDSAAGRVGGDGMDGESVISGGGAVMVHYAGGSGVRVMLRDGVVIGAGETQAHAVVADVAVPIAPDLACATSHARVRWLLGRVGDVHQYEYECECECGCEREREYETAAASRSDPSCG